MFSTVAFGCEWVRPVFYELELELDYPHTYHCLQLPSAPSTSLSLSLSTSLSTSRPFLPFAVTVVRSMFILHLCGWALRVSAVNSGRLEDSVALHLLQNKS